MRFRSQSLFRLLSIAGIAVKEREKGGEMLMKPFNGREMCNSKRGTNRTEEASKVNY